MYLHSAGQYELAGHGNRVTEQGMMTGRRHGAPEMTGTRQFVGNRHVRKTPPGWVARLLNANNCIRTAGQTRIASALSRTQHIDGMQIQFNSLINDSSASATMPVKI
jgi:hypothetical protein